MPDGRGKRDVGLWTVVILRCPPKRSEGGPRRMAPNSGLHAVAPDQVRGRPFEARRKCGSHLRVTANCYPSILEKSATARVASRISFSSLSRFSRRSDISTLTVTFSKNASTSERNLAIAAIAPS